MMGKSGKRKRCRFLALRRQQRAKSRRHSMKLVNKIVKQQMEKRIKALHSEFLVLIYAVREEILALLQEILAELMLAEERQGLPDPYNLDQELRTFRFRQKMDDEEAEKIEEVESTNVSFSQILLTGKPQNNQPGSSVTSHASTSSLPAQCEHQKNQLASLADANNQDTGQLVIPAEQSRTDFHINHMTRELRCQEETGHRVNSTKEEDDLILQRQWEEWMNQQEKRGNLIKIKPGVKDSRLSENQGEAAKPMSEEGQSQNEKRVSVLKKFKIYLNDVFTPSTAPKWEKFENEN